MKKKIILACSVCGKRNYSVEPKKDQTVRLEIKKYCPHCNQHTLHKQTI